MNNSVKPLLSVIVPVYNEVESVVKLHSELLTVLRTLGLPFEIIYIDDGSTDNTYERLISLVQIKIIRFRRNFGQTAAMDAGIKVTTGDYLIMLDGDGQNDPADIPQLIEKLEREKLDVVSGWRKIRRDNFSKRFFSLVAAFLRKLLINDGIHDSGCTLKVYRRECFDGVDLMGEMHRFIPALLKIRGFKIGEMKVNHRPRLVGKTKYTWRRGLKGILDMMSVWFWQKYASRPLHLFGGLGFLFGLVGVFSLVTLFVLRLFYFVTLADKIWPLISIFMILMGVNFFISGILADIMVKDYFKNNRRDYYLIAETKEQ
ncbi:MAG: glycosyltransferase family 2 protein [Candidatus Vogelbacteria bacterium]|nr:glycosyltransferase family 2 protein [Candidatus Vogelbacteria bacterium]